MYKSTTQLPVYNNRDAQCDNFVYEMYKEVSGTPRVKNVVDIPKPPKEASQKNSTVAIFFFYEIQYSTETGSASRLSKFK